MDKEKYLVDLENTIKRLPDKKLRKIIQKYEKIIEENSLTTEKEIENFLGTPKQLGRKILADNALEMFEKIKNHHPQLVTINWQTFMAMFRVVCCLPRIYTKGTWSFLGLFLLGIMLFITCFILVLATAFFVVIGSLLIYSGILTLKMAFAVGMFHLGVGLIFIGTIYILIPLLHKLYVYLFAKICVQAQKIYIEFKDKCMLNFQSSRRINDEN